MQLERYWPSELLALLSSSLIFVACQPDRALVPPKAAQIPVRSVVGPPVPDQVMGDFSTLARHIVAGLQDSRVRALIAESMKSPDARGMGLDLGDCASGSVVGQLLEAGSRRGGAPAAELCSRFQAAGGMTLYMSRDRLARWDSKVIPIVTAVVKPDQPITAPFLGYRSPDRTIQLDPAAPLEGPILIVLPFTHPSRWALSTPRPGRVEPRIMPPMTESKVVPATVVPTIR
ncbi:MAG: hypothetical protein JWL97_809 [Gemmatimonadales bacterium]|jgi:hypothetical protein|nr:hypothetical protein [Gemmatimonadales bacterium]